MSCRQTRYETVFIHRIPIAEHYAEKTKECAMQSYMIMLLLRWTRDLLGSANQVMGG